MAQEDSEFYFKPLPMEPFLLSRDGETMRPGGSHPFNFEPTEHLLSGQNTISHIPGQPTNLLRWYPGIRHKKTGSIETEITSVLEANAEHFGLLQDIGGIILPKFTQVLGRAPDSDRLAIYATVEKVVGCNAETISDDALVVDKIAKPLLDYYEWVISSSSEYFLQDLSERRQFMLGRLACNHNQSDEAMYLIDIEPRIYRFFKNGERDVIGAEQLKYDLYTLRNDLATLPATSLAVQKCLERVNDLIYDLE